jgi:starch-binding outer membrane protein, SusD/RagB family
MTRNSKVAAVSLGLVLGAAGCGSFLVGDKLTNNPNSPSQATAEQLFVGVQANMFSMQENTVAMTVCMWMQQCMGVGGRFVDQFAHYTVNEFSWDGNWFQVYTGGGLVDLRKIEATEAAAGDSTFLGIAKIWEAFDMGVAADLWGDVPYSDAVGSNPTPTLDGQLAVYSAVQTLLSQAITELSSGKGVGPLGNDLVFNCDSTLAKRSLWIAAAHTLKARFLLHTVEANPGTAATIYGNAITEASAGIGGTAGDLKTFHTGATSERNIWYQFQTTTFGQDVVAGKTLVDIMRARSDPRLPEYFGTNKGGGYGGEDVNVPQPGDSVSALSQSLRQCPDPSSCGLFRQPLVTYQENELILAESYNKTSNDALALVHLNNARAVPGLSALAAVTGPALLDSIMIEKYVTMFQNIETWNDYRRTCLPALVPDTTANPIFRKKIPGRLYYSGSEGNVNPHIPDPSTQLGTNGFRNANDTADCP